MTEPLLSERIGRVLVLTLNRPEARNAMNAALVEGLVNNLREADRDPGVGAVIVTGTDPVFCSGADLKEMSGTDDPESMIHRIEQSVEMYSLIAKLNKPVIAAVNGHAVAGGCGLAMACDLVVAADHAEFGYPEVLRDLVAAIVMVSLSRLVPKRVAVDLLLSGRRVTAAEARDIGMVNRVVDPSSLKSTALEIAEKLASRDPVIIGLTKQLFYRVSDLPWDDAFDRAGITNLVMRLLRARNPGDAFEVGRSG